MSEDDDGLEAENGQQEEEEEEEEFFTLGSDELLKSRRDLAEFSLPR